MNFSKKLADSHTECRGGCVCFGRDPNFTNFEPHQEASNLPIYTPVSNDNFEFGSVSTVRQVAAGDTAMIWKRIRLGH